MTSSARTQTRKRCLTGLLPVLALMLGVTTTHVSAQAEGVLPKTTQLPASTRAMALGDSYVMNAGHADALFYHPALLTGASGVGFEVQRWGTNSSSATLSAAVEWLGGGVGIGVRTLQYSAFGSDVLAAPAGQDHLFGFGSVPVSERVATIGYARETFFDIDLGIGVDLVDQRVGTGRQSVALFDIGVAREIGPLAVGLTVHDLGEKPMLDSGAGPAKVVLGAGAYGQQVGIFDLGYAANLGFAEDDVTYGGGVEIGYWPVQGRTFVARAGFQSVPDGSEAKPFTTGLAFWGDDITIEWAFRPFGGADEGGSHRFGLRWR
jgi:hypothetical protein